MGAKDVCRIDEPHRGSAFDSPGLANDSAGYPGLAYSLWGTTPSVLRFFNSISCQKEERAQRKFAELTNTIAFRF